MAGSTVESAVAPPSSAACAAPWGGGSSSIAAVPVMDLRPTHKRGPNSFVEDVPLQNQEWPYPHPRPCLATTRLSSLDPRRIAQVDRASACSTRTFLRSRWARPPTTPSSFLRRRGSCVGRCRTSSTGRLQRWRWPARRAWPITQGRPSYLGLTTLAFFYALLWRSDASVFVMALSPRRIRRRQRPSTPLTVSRTSPSPPRGKRSLRCGAVWLRVLARCPSIGGAS